MISLSPFSITIPVKPPVAPGISRSPPEVGITSLWNCACRGRTIKTKAVLKRLPKAHAALAELKGIASTIPNQGILINTLGLQKAKDSSAIENIITTHDDLYKSGLNITSVKSLNAKEVQNYISALKSGFELISEQGMLTNRTILKVQEILEDNSV